MREAVSFAAPPRRGNRLTPQDDRQYQVEQRKQDGRRDTLNDPLEYGIIGAEGTEIVFLAQTRQVG